MQKNRVYLQNVVTIANTIIMDAPLFDYNCISMNSSRSTNRNND